MNEAVKDNVNGYIVNSRKPELMAEKIMTYLNSDNSIRKDMTESARKTIKEKFSPERQIREFSDLYNSILAG
jgi:glycosyltransferase involved in cell wall biosynthesis